MQFYSPSIHEIFPQMDTFGSCRNFSSHYQLQIRFRWHLSFGLWNHLEAKMEQILKVYWWSVRWRKNWILRGIQALAAFLYSHIMNRNKIESRNRGAKQLWYTNFSVSQNPLKLYPVCQRTKGRGER